MTVTDVTPIRTRRRDRTRTSAAARLRELELMLDDPFWADRVDDIRAAIRYLTATTVLAA
jgi:GrpB-like predicted nucleotidyltransferase (UPF0157 family)